MTTTLPATAQHQRFCRLMKKYTSIHCSVSDNIDVITLKHKSNTKVLKTLDLDKVADFFDIPKLRSVTAAFEQHPIPKYIIYVKSLAYVPQFAHPITEPMLDSIEGTAGILAYLDQHKKDMTHINVMEAPEFRHLKTPLVFDIVNNTAYPYRAAATKIMELLR